MSRIPEAVQNTTSGGFDIVPNDTTDLSKPTKGIYVGAAGDVKVMMVDGATVTFKALSVGVYHPIAARRVFATYTTAISIVGLY